MPGNTRIKTYDFKLQILYNKKLTIKNNDLNTEKQNNVTITYIL